MITPSGVSLFTTGGQSLCVEMICCERCHEAIKSRNLVTILTWVALVVGIVSIVTAETIWCPKLGEAFWIPQFFTMVAAIYYGPSIMRKITQLDDVAIRDGEFIKQGNKLSRKHFRIANPHFWLSARQGSAKKVELFTSE